MSSSPKKDTDTDTPTHSLTHTHKREGERRGVPGADGAGTPSESANPSCSWSFQFKRSVILSPSWINFTMHVSAPSGGKQIMGPTRETILIP